jgi:gluconolactonase
MNLRVLAEGLRFPEGPVAMADGSVLLVEIERGAVARIDGAGTHSTVARPGGGPNGLALGPDGAFYVCNNGGFAWDDMPGRLRPLGPAPSYQGGWVERIDPATGAITILYAQCGGQPLTGPNDLVFDAHGGFYFTDYGKVHPRQRDLGGLYYALPDGTRCVEVAFPLLAPNGVGLSPDGSVVYVAETDTCRLWAFDIEAPGQAKKDPWPSPHGGRLVAGLGGYQRFDSLAVAASGNICVATLVTGAVSVIAPDGRLLGQAKFPDAGTTNLCFGGPDLRTAFVTQSYTGKLVAVPWPEPGLKLNFQQAVA